MSHLILNLHVSGRSRLHAEYVGTIKERNRGEGPSRDDDVTASLTDPRLRYAINKQSKYNLLPRGNIESTAESLFIARPAGK